MILRLAPGMRGRALKGDHILRCGALLIYVALILLVLVHIGQVNPDGVARSISIINMNVSNLGTALQAGTEYSSTGLYNSENRSIGVNEGLHTIYSWGLYSVCGYTSNATWDSGGACTTSSIAHSFGPFDAILQDVPLQYGNVVAWLILNAGRTTKFTNSGYFEALTQTAYYFILIATVFTWIALGMCIWKTTATLLFTNLFLISSAISCLISSRIWSAVISEARNINDIRIAQGTSIGIVIEQGNALNILWAAFTLMVVALLPYQISWRTYRR